MTHHAPPIEGGQGRTPDELTRCALHLGWVCGLAMATGGGGWLVALLF